MLDIKLFIDFKSPASYLALGPTKLLEVEYPIHITWYPFQSRQRSLPIKQPNETRGESHIRVREEQRRQMHLHYARIQNLQMSFPQDFGSTDLALDALYQNFTLTDAKPNKFLELAFAAYWQDHQDLNNPDVVQYLLEQSTMASQAEAVTISETETQTRHLQRQELATKESLHSAQEYALSCGVIDAPTYLVNEQLFLGREHLPWIRQLASHRGEAI